MPVELDGIKSKYLEEEDGYTEIHMHINMLSWYSVDEIECTQFWCPVFILFIKKPKKIKKYLTKQRREYQEERLEWRENVGE